MIEFSEELTRRVVRREAYVKIIRHLISLCRLYHVSADYILGLRPH